MCGIFGFASFGLSPFSPLQQRAVMDRLFLLSESRGKEAAGIAALTSQHIAVYRQPVAPAAFITKPAYLNILAKAAQRQDFCAIAHSRLVTNGDKSRPANNQPVIQRGMACVHNGIIVNASDLYREFQFQKQYEIDSEVLTWLMDHALSKSGDMAGAVRWALDKIEGSASIAVLFEQWAALVLATNTGSMYYGRHSQGRFCIFASEAFIVQQVLRSGPLAPYAAATRVEQIPAGQAALLNLNDGSFQSFALEGLQPSVHVSRFQPPLGIQETAPADAPAPFQNVLFHNSRQRSGAYAGLYQECVESSWALKRCVRCVLPQTVPLIAFDAEGVCNFCRDFVPFQPLGPKVLKELIQRHRPAQGPDCLVALSGGRDSSYLLHYVKKEFDARVIAYTYDWGMVTDLARRNQARLCGKLGVEHIIVSADIDQKRCNIRQNVNAWLRRPSLGMIPLFMAGDKQYFTHGYALKNRLGAGLLLLGENLLEKTGFKTGFCGIKEYSNQLSYGMSLINKFGMVGFYTKEFAFNPAYLNGSLADTLDAFWAYYMHKHDYENFYRYVPWDEPAIDAVLKKEYGWESAPDAESTWRIGDGTAAFYNYIYYVIAGFSEHDTLRSNQVRQGVLDRDEALHLAARDNQSRYDAIQWYCDTIGIDMGYALERIHAAAKIY